MKLRAIYANGELSLLRDGTTSVDLGAEFDYMGREEQRLAHQS
jgi:hypothetical protein